MNTLLFALFLSQSPVLAAENPIVTRAQQEALEDAPVTDVAAPPESSSPIDWARVDSKSEKVYKAGKITLLSGMGASLMGSIIGQEELALAGGLAFMTGIGVKAGASLRQRRSLVERGQKTPATWGVAAWSLFGSSFALSLAGSAAESANPSGISDPNLDTINGTAMALSLSGVVAQIAAIVASSAQHNANRKARYQYMREAATRPPR